MNYTDDLKKSLVFLNRLLKNSQNLNFLCHMLKALLHKEIGLDKLLFSLEQNIYYLEELAEIRIVSYPKSGNIIENPSGNDNVIAVFREADNIGLRLLKDSIDPVSVLAASKVYKFIFQILN